jgi:hypothetical protein
LIFFPSPLTRALVWAFILAPFAQPSLLETFLRLSPFPATSRPSGLLPARLRSNTQIFPPNTQSPGLPVGDANLESYFFIFFQVSTPVGHSLPLDVAGSPRTPSIKKRASCCVFLWSGVRLQAESFILRAEALVNGVIEFFLRSRE